LLQEHDWSRMLLLCSWYYFLCKRNYQQHSTLCFQVSKPIFWSKSSCLENSACFCSRNHNEWAQGALSRISVKPCVYVNLFCRNCKDRVYHRIWQTFVVELITVICWSRNTNDIIMKMLLTIRTNPACNITSYGAITRENWTGTVRIYI
jgi:hypothetical protein